MTQFAFLQSEWPAVLDAAARAEAAVHADPRTACCHARRALELAVGWAYKHDAALKLPYQHNLSALIHEPSFKQTASEAVFSKEGASIREGHRRQGAGAPDDEGPDGAGGDRLGKTIVFAKNQRLFDGRLELIGELDARLAASTGQSVEEPRPVVA